MDASRLSILLRMRATTIVLLVSVTLGAARIASADVPPDTLKYTVLVGESRVGSQLWIVRSTDGGTEGTTRTTLRVDRGGESLLMTQDVRWHESLSGDLERMSSVSTGMGPVAWRDSIAWIPTRAVWRRTRARGGDATVDSLIGGPLVGPAALDRAFAWGGSGGPARVAMCDPDEMRPEVYRIRQTGTDTLRLGDGTSVPCRIFSVEDSSASPTVVEQWRDARGALWREVDRALGVTSERSEVASGGGDGEGVGGPNDSPRPRFDAARWALVPIIGALPRGGPCTLILEPAGPGTFDSTRTSLLLPDGPGQAVARGSRAGMWIVRLAPTPAIATSESDRAVWRGDPALEGALRSGLVVDSATPAIQAFADSVASRGGGNPTAEALLLEKAVYHRIRLKDYSTVMGTASETLARGRGDCTEHAVLLGAVCRARGIPARLVAGLTPAGAEQMAWHLWTEVWLGSWVALDATRGLGAPAPATVALLRMERPEDEIGNLERSIGVLSAGYRFRVSEETR